MNPVLVVYCQWTGFVFGTGDDNRFALKNIIMLSSWIQTVCDEYWLLNYNFLTVLYIVTEDLNYFFWEGIVSNCFYRGATGIKVSRGLIYAFGFFFFNFWLKMCARIYRYLTTIYEGVLKYFGQGSATLSPSLTCVCTYILISCSNYVPQTR